MQITKIISSHSDINSAIEALGEDSLNRAYNPRLFDKAVGKIQMSGARCHIIEDCGRNIIVYEFSCDIKLLNKFSPFSACLTSGFELGVMNVEKGEIYHCGRLDYGSRKLIAKMQKEMPDAFVLNF
jgi:hypothetical protein